MQWSEVVDSEINQKKGIHFWTVSTGKRVIDQWGSADGIPGILLVFIKAYEVLKDPSYREIAESNLQNIPFRPALMDFTLGSGLAGLGELYLEAFRVFNNQEWKKRADWIASLLINCFQAERPDAGYWRAEPSNITTSDLFSGNAGILHFLLRCLDPNKFRYPLDPSANGISKANKY